MVRAARIWQDPAMRDAALGAVRVAACFGLVLALGACRRSSAPAAASGDELVLEVGGQGTSLRATLVGLGRSPAPPHQLVERDVPQPLPASFDVSDAPMPPRDPVVEPELDPERDPAPEQQPPAPPPPQWTMVSLGDGETLIHVARRCLGDGRRYDEVMQWNGWSERDARRLRVGQPVKILTSEMR